MKLCLAVYMAGSVKVMGKLPNSVWDLTSFLTCNKCRIDFRLIFMWLYFL